jgi:chromosome segregation ATPase
MQNEPPVAPCPHNRAPPSAAIETEEDGALTCPDIAEILQNQIFAALKSRKVASEPFQRPQIPDFDLYMDALEKIAAEAEVRSERWRQEAEAELKRAESLETKVAALEQAVKEGEVRSEQWREQAETAAKIVASLQTNIAALKEDLTEAKTIAERWRHEAKDAAKRANDLVAELYELTCEHVEMVALRAGQSAV